jgi:ribosomal 30S subunit maturation factor RimM
VVTQAGDEVGVVGSVMFGGSAPLLSVGTGVDGEDVLVPLAADICTGVDVEAKRIVIAPPDGLLELNRRRRDR